MLVECHLSCIIAADCPLDVGSSGGQSAVTGAMAFRCWSGHLVDEGTMDDPVPSCRDAYCLILRT